MYVSGKGVHCKHCSLLIYELVKNVWLHQLSDAAWCCAKTVAEPEEELITEDEVKNLVKDYWKELLGDQE